MAGRATPTGLSAAVGSAAMALSRSPEYMDSPEGQRGGTDDSVLSLD